MLKKIISLFKQKDKKSFKNNNSIFLNDIWVITSTYFDFETYIASGRSRFYESSFIRGDSDITKYIFETLDYNLKLTFNVLSLKNINKKYSSLEEPLIIKNMYINCSEEKLQIKFCEVLLKTIHSINNINNIFEEYINRINKILRQRGYYYSLTTRQILVINCKFEEENINSLFPLLEDYGQSQEFIIKAYEEFINGDYDNSVINSGKATETVMKCICNRRSYSITSDNYTFSKLFETLNSNNFFKREEYTSPTVINNIIEGLKTGLPKHRNYSAHGSSIETKKSNKYVAKLTLDLMVSYIHYFISIDKKL